MGGPRRQGSAYGRCRNDSGDADVFQHREVSFEKRGIEEGGGCGGGY